MNTFNTGDEVVYTPTKRTMGLLANDNWSVLKTGGRYRIASISNVNYITLEGLEGSPGGGLYYTSFEPAADVPDTRHIVNPLRVKSLTAAELDDALTNDIIVGHFIYENGVLVGDSAENMVDNLLLSRLKRVSSREGGWALLLRNPFTGHYWELTYPELKLNDAGPRTLTRITDYTASELYNLNVGKH